MLIDGPTPRNRLKGLVAVPSAGAGRILFVGEAVSLAHVARPAMLARWAREAGHEVVFACGRRYAHVARGEGLDPIAIETVDATAFYTRLAKGGFFYTTEELQRYVRAEIELLNRVKPDLVVGDFRLTLPISAELTGVKCLTLANAHWSPAAERRLPAPEGGVFGLLPRFLREKIFSVVSPLAYRYFAAPLDRVRRSCGLPAFNDFRKHYTTGDWCAYLDLPELYRVSRTQDPEPGTPANHFFLGPVLWHPQGLPEPELGRLGLERPLAYVSMGSSGDGRRLPELLRALLADGCDAAVSGVKPAEASALRRAVPELAGRSLIAEFFDPRPVLEAAALTVCHGGSGTVYQSLAHGVPVLCCPSNPDQRLVSEAVLDAGSGLVAESHDLRRQIAEVASQRCLAQARRMASAIRRNDTRGRWLALLGRRRTVKNSLTQRLRRVEEEVLGLPAAPESFRFADGRYTIRVANDLESRKKAYGLVYQLYLEKEYAKPNSSKLWLSIYDALPETVTLLVERQAEGTTAASAVPSALDPQPSVFSAPVGALTVVFDSPIGLPADKVYKPELDALRSSGRRLAEVVSLGVAEEAVAGSEILVKLFNFAYFVARGLRGATDFVVTVNPRHVRFYEKTLLLEPAGPERNYDKVAGAPAMLLRLDLAVPEEQVRLEHEKAEMRPRRSRTLYPMFLLPEQESDVIAGLAAQFCPMTAHELGYFFIAETDLLKQATPDERDYIQSRYQAHETLPRR